MRDRLQAILDLARHRKRISRSGATIAWGTVLSTTALSIAITLRSVETAEAQTFQQRQWYESPVTVGPTVLTTSGDREESLTLVFENQTDSVTVSTPIIGFMRTDTDSFGNFVTETTSHVPADAPTATSWIHGLPDTVILQPHQRRLVAFTITPPHTLADGVYYAAINIPQANEKKQPLTESSKNWGAGAGDWEPSPTVLVLVRHNAPDTTHIHVDSLTLAGNRACFRMWSEHGTPYVGTMFISLHTPPVRLTKYSASATPLALQARPFALYGVPSPKRFCTQLVALPDHLPGSQIYADWVYALGIHRRILPSTFSGPAILDLAIGGGWRGGGYENDRIGEVPNEFEPRGTPHGEATVDVSPRSWTR